MKRTVPTHGATLSTIAALTLRRLRRGRTQWVGLAIACLPIMFAAVISKAAPHSEAIAWTGMLFDIFVIELLVLAVLPALFVASSIGDEIEDRTTTYLWSRPVARWTILIGKLVALAPIAVVLVVASWLAAVQLGANMMAPLSTTLGLAAAALAISIVAAGMSTLVPKHGMALTIIYMLLFDLPIGQIPASLQILSITHNASLIANLGLDSVDTGPLAPAITIAVIAGFWLAIGLRRISRLES
jgi:ABC-type transport system involved in multi-copper enzyme maturation permease subunit